MRKTVMDQRVKLALTKAECQHRCLVAEDASMYEALRRRLDCGQVVRPLPGMFLSAETWNDGYGRPRIRWRYAHDTYADLHPNCVFAAFSAALEYGLWVPRGQLGKMFLAVENSGHTRGSAKIVRIQCPASEMTELRGRRITTLMRTVLDCSLRGSLGDGLAIADSAVRYYGLDLTRYRNYVAEHAVGRRGAKQAREVARFADGASENGGESYVRARIIELGFMPPTSLQFEAFDPIDGGVLRVDMFYEFEDGTCLFVEVDGLEKYGNSINGGDGVKSRLVKERQRESHLMALGIPVMRILFSRINEPGYLESLLLNYGVPRRA